MALPNFTTQDAATYKANIDGTAADHETRIGANETGKQDTITGAATSITSSNLTASRALVSDSGGKVAVSATTSTEIGYVNGVTSAIQTQLDGKAPAFRGAVASMSTAQTVASSGTSIALSFDSELYDTDSIHNVSTNNTRLTVPSGVSYIKLTANLEMDTTTGEAFCWVRKNGSIVAPTGGLPSSAKQTEEPGATGYVAITMSSHALPVSASDYFELMYRHGAGVDRDVEAYFGMEIIS